MPKIISVSKGNKTFLEQALKSAGQGVAWGAGAVLGQDAYNTVKKHLRDNNIAFNEHEDARSIPNDHIHH